MVKTKATKRKTKKATGVAQRVGSKIGKEIDKEIAKECSCEDDCTCDCGEGCSCGCGSRNYFSSCKEGCGYFLGFLGAAIYYISTATSFGMGFVGFLKALVWPAFLVFEILKFIGK